MTFWLLCILVGAQTSPLASQSILPGQLDLTAQGQCSQEQPIPQQSKHGQTKEERLGGNTSPINDLLKQTLEQAVQVASLSYCTTQVIVNKFCKLCSQELFKQANFHVIELAEHDLKWVSTFLDNKIYVSFRGSVSKKNWEQNVHSLAYKQLEGDDPLNSRKPRVGRGWTLVLEQSIAMLKRQLKALIEQHPKAPIYFVGQSAGGAFATLAAFMGTRPDGFLTSLNIPPSRLNIITFASPKVGNRQFVQDFEKTGFASSYRVAKTTDLFHHLPLFGYEHIGKEVIVSNAFDTPLLCDGAQCSKTCILKPLAFLWNGAQAIREQHME